jgi:DNA invertase Pin-like site-specific DNA recombinase
MRAAIYARYSSENQREASIEDQVRLCKARIEAEGWTTATTYTDFAQSGATHLRPGYQQLLADARSGTFDIVVAEALDRLSRDQEHVAGFFKQLTFCGVKIVTVAEGEINELHVGLKGTMNALFLSDLRQKVRRGLEGRVRQGRSGGGLCYGYDVVREVDARGEPVCGGRVINEPEAGVVRRIFNSFARGCSPRAIAHALNREHVPGPDGRPWADTTIRGHALRRTGILRNELYVGRLVWNKQRYIKEPSTGKRLARVNPKHQWVIQNVPDLRIVDDELWDRVQARLAGIRDSAGAQKARDSKFWLNRRPQHLLTALAQCGICGAPLAAAGKDYLSCSAARRLGTCTNRKGTRRGVLEGIILDALKDNLMHPDLVAEFIREFHAEVNRQRREAELSVGMKRRELDEVSRKLDGLIEAIADGFRAPLLQSKLDELEQRKIALESDITSAPTTAPRLHPTLAELYRRKIASLEQALADPATGTEALEILRGLIERVSVRHTEKGVEVELVGEIANMVTLSAGAESVLKEPYRSSVKVVAGERNQRYLLPFWSKIPVIGRQAMFRA